MGASWGALHKNKYRVSQECRVLYKLKLVEVYKQEEDDIDESRKVGRFL